MRSGCAATINSLSGPPAAMKIESENGDVTLLGEYSYPSIEVSADGSATFEIAGLSDGQEAYLIVAASAPHSLIPAHYSISTE